MKRFYTVSFFLLSILFVQGQNLSEAWAINAGGASVDSGKAIAVDHRGGVYIGGSFSSTSFAIGNFTLNRTGTNTDGFLAKLDTLGNVLWTTSFANGDITAVAVDAAGFIYVIGKGVPLTKLTNSGTVLWQSGSGINYRTIEIDSHGNIYAGDYFGFTKYRSDGALVYKNLPLFIRKSLGAAFLLTVWTMPILFFFQTVLSNPILLPSLPALWQNLFMTA